MECNANEEWDIFQNEQKKIFNVDAQGLRKEVDFCAEIYSIMHAFGDVKKPLHSSVKLMYNILLGQMDLLIKNAENIMMLRKATKISHEDVLFLLRKNKVLLKRLLHFLFVEDTRGCFYPGSNKLDDVFSMERGERVSQSLKYLAFIEKFKGDLTSVLSDKNIVDDVYIKRLKRKDLMTNLMTQAEYEQFFEYTLKVSFCHKYTKEKFKEWLQQFTYTMLDITPLAMSIFHFLARETVAAIVDKALEIKSRKYGKSDNFPLENFNNPFHKLEIDKSKNNLKPYFSETSEASFNKYVTGDIEDRPSKTITKNKFIEKNIVNNSPNDIQETSLFSHASHDTNNIVNCPITTGTTKRTRFIENNIIDNSPSYEQKKLKCSISCHLNQNGSSKCYANSKPDFISNASTSKSEISNHFLGTNKNLNDNLEKSKTSYDRCDNFKPDDGRFSDNGCNMKDDTNSSMNYESRANQASSDDLFYASDAPRKTSKKHYLSLNFQEKPLFICFDALKDHKINTSLVTKADRDNDLEDTEDNDVGKSCIVEFIKEPDLDEFKLHDFAIRSLSYNSGKCSGHSSFTVPMKMNCKVAWFPKEAIIPAEIQAAFIHYQRPLPMSYLMKMKVSDLPPRKINLVCLANPNE